jgi:hypothetical protein
VALPICHDEDLFQFRFKIGASLAKNPLSLRSLLQQLTCRWFVHPAPRSGFETRTIWLMAADKTCLFSQRSPWVSCRQVLPIGRMKDVWREKAAAGRPPQEFDP